MAVPRSLYLVAGAAAAPAGLCASAMAPVAGVLAGAIAVGLVLLLTAAGALLAADWRAQVESRQVWAEVASAWADCNAGVGRSRRISTQATCRPSRPTRCAGSFAPTVSCRRRPRPSRSCRPQARLRSPHLLGCFPRGQLGKVCRGACPIEETMPAHRSGTTRLAMRRWSGQGQPRG